MVRYRKYIVNETSDFNHQGNLLTINIIFHDTNHVRGTYIECISLKKLSSPPVY